MWYRHANVVMEGGVLSRLSCLKHAKIPLAWFHVDCYGRERFGRSCGLFALINEKLQVRIDNLIDGYRGSD